MKINNIEEFGLISSENVLKNITKSNLLLVITFFLFPINDILATYSFALAIIRGFYGLISLRKKCFNEINHFLIFPLIFSVYLLFSVYYSKAIFDIETVSKYAILSLAPIAFVDYKIVNTRLFSNWFLFGILISIIVASVRFIHIASYSLHYSDLINYFKVHPVYYSAYLSLAISSLLFNKHKYRFWYITILTVFILLLQSRIAYITIFSLFSFFLLKKKLLKFFIPISLGFILFIFGVSKTSKTPLQLAVSERIQIWDSAIEAVKQRPVIGYGVGSEYFELGIHFFYDGKFQLLDDGKNSHNMYLSILIQFGVVGLFLFLGIFVSPLYFIKNKYSLEFIGFLIILGFVSLTESIFFRNWSVIFVLFLNSYLYGYKKN